MDSPHWDNSPAGVADEREEAAAEEQLIENTPPCRARARDPRGSRLSRRWTEPFLEAGRQEGERAEVVAIPEAGAIKSKKGMEIVVLKN